MHPEVLGDLVGPDRRTDTTAYRHALEPARNYTYGSFCSTAWQTANLLRLYGVHDGATVGIVDAPKDPEDRTGSASSRPPGTPIPEVLFGLFGASMVGGVVTFDPNGAFDGSALLCPASQVGEFEVGPECTVLAYGGPPSDPAVVHFESEVWSETPIAPPETVAPDAAVLSTAGKTYTHADLLSAAREFVDQRDLSEEVAVGIEAPLSHPGTVAGGVLAPLLAGGTIEVGGAQPDYVLGGDGIDPARVIRTGSAERDSPA